MSTETTPPAPVVPAPAPSRFGFFSRILGPAAPAKSDSPAATAIAETKPEPQQLQEAPASVADSGTLLRERLRARVPISANQSSNASQPAAQAAPAKATPKKDRSKKPTNNQFKLFGDVLVQPNANSDVLDRLLDQAAPAPKPAPKPAARPVASSPAPAPQAAPSPPPKPTPQPALPDPTPPKQAPSPQPDPSPPAEPIKPLPVQPTASNLDDVVVPVMASIALRNRLNARVPISASRIETPSRLNRAESSSSTTSSALRDRMNARAPISAALASRTPITAAINNRVLISAAVANRVPISEAVNNRVPISAALSNRVPIASSRTEAPATSNYASRSLNRSESAVSSALRERLAARQPISARLQTQPGRGTPNLSLDTTVEQTTSLVSGQEPPAPATANGGVFDRFFAARANSEAVSSPTTTIPEKSPVAEPVKVAPRAPQSLASVARSAVVVSTATSSLRERMAARQPISTRLQTNATQNAIPNRFAASRFQAQPNVEQNPPPVAIPASPEKPTPDILPVAEDLAAARPSEPESSPPTSDPVLPAANAGVFNRLFGARAAAAPTSTDVSSEIPAVQPPRFARQAAPSSFASVATQAVAVNSATSSLRERMAARVPITAAQPTTATSRIARSPSPPKAQLVEQEPPKPEPEPESSAPSAGIFSNIFGSKPATVELVKEEPLVQVVKAQEPIALPPKIPEPVSKPTVKAKEPIVPSVKALEPVSKPIPVTLENPAPILTATSTETDAAVNTGVFGRLFGRQAKPTEIKADDISPKEEAKVVPKPEVVQNLPKEQIEPTPNPIEVIVTKELTIETKPATKSPQIATKQLQETKPVTKPIEVITTKQLQIEQTKPTQKPIETITVTAIPREEPTIVEIAPMKPLPPPKDLQPRRTAESSALPQLPVSPIKVNPPKRLPKEEPELTTSPEMARIEVADIKEEPIFPVKSRSMSVEREHEGPGLLAQPAKEVPTEIKSQERPEIGLSKATVLSASEKGLPKLPGNVSAAPPAAKKDLPKIPGDVPTIATRSQPKANSRDPDAEAKEEIARLNAQFMAEEALAAERKKPEIPSIPEPAPTQKVKQPPVMTEDEKAMAEIARLNAEIMAEALAAESKAKAVETKPQESLVSKWFFSAPKPEPKPLSEDELAMQEIARLNAEIMAEAMAAEKAVPLPEPPKPEPPKATGFFSNILSQPTKPVVKASVISEEEKALEEIAKLNAEIMAAQVTTPPEPKAAAPKSNPDSPKATGFFSNILGQPKKPVVSEEDKAREEIARLNAAIMAEALAAEKSKPTSEPPKPETPKATGFFSGILAQPKKPDTKSEEEKAREEIARLNAKSMVGKQSIATLQHVKPDRPKTIGFSSNILTPPKKPVMSDDDDRAKEDIAKLNAQVMADIMTAEAPLVSESRKSEPKKWNLFSNIMNKPEVSEEEKAREEIKRLQEEIMAEESRQPTPKSIDFFSRTILPPTHPAFAPRTTLEEEKARGEIARLNAEVLAEIQTSKGLTANAISQSQTANLIGADVLSAARAEERENEKILSGANNRISAEELQAIQVREELEQMKAEIMAEDLSDMESEVEYTEPTREEYVEPITADEPREPEFVPAKPKYDLAYFEELAKERAREEIARMKADTQSASESSKTESISTPIEDDVTAEDLEILRAREELAIMTKEMEDEYFTDDIFSEYETEDEKETPLTSSSSSSLSADPEIDANEVLKPLWLAEGVPISSRVSLLNKGLDGLMKDLKAVEV